MGALGSRGSDTAPEIGSVVPVAFGRGERYSPMARDPAGVKRCGGMPNEGCARICGSQLSLAHRLRFADPFDTSQSDARLLVVADLRVSGNVDEEVAPSASIPITVRKIPLP